MMYQQEEFPYGGGSDPNSGFVRGGGSEDRARSEDASGTTSERQRKALIEIGVAGSDGMTWRELAQQQGWHHGQASGCLSTLHKGGRIARLALRRKRCAIYVTPDNINGRVTEHPAETETTKMLRQAIELVGLFANNPPCRHRAADPDILNCRNCQAHELVRRYESRR